MNFYLNLFVTWSEEIVRTGIISSNAMIGAAISLWITFVIFGIIAMRFEKVLKRKTQWQFIIIAPSGILVYAILRFYSSVILGNLKMAGNIEIIGYSLFFISGVLSLIGSLRFKDVIFSKKESRFED